MICYQCGKEIEQAKAVFCPHCNAYVNQVVANQRADALSALPDQEKKRANRQELRKALLTSLHLLLAFFASLAAVMMTVMSGQNAAAAVFSIVATLLVGSLLFKVLHRSEAQEPDSLETLLQSAELLSPKKLTRLFIREELKSHASNGGKRVSKRAVTYQLIYALILAAVLFLLLNTLYYKTATFLLVGILLLVYETLALKTTTLEVLYQQVKKHPDETLSAIIARETFDEQETPKVKRTVLASCAAILLAVVCFVGLHLETRYEVEETENGYAVSAYVPRLFEDTAVVIPDTIDGKRIIAIGQDAFAGNAYVREITVPDAVIRIEDDAFSGCRALTTVNGIDNVTHIGSGAFSGCRSLTDIALPDGLTTLNGESFKDCKSLLSVTIPTGVTEIRGNTFDGCSKLESVTLHEGIIDIHAYAFDGCAALKEIQLPSKITEIHTYTFNDCDSLKSIVIPRGVTRIAAHAFSGCDELSSVYIPDSLKEIGSSAFRDCDSLTVLYLPPDVSINERAFKDSPTKLYKKPFTDDVSDKVEAEMSENIVKNLYAVYDMTLGKDTVFSYYDNSTLLVLDRPDRNGLLEDNMGLLVLETPTEFLAYLKKARDSGFDTVVVGRYSKVASAATKSAYWVSYDFTVDELIETYETDASEF